ncbi:hypothetical protein J5J10_11775 [Ciceribacter sp. L1K23]|uniref:hypothetical protein n=1 Tax=Ciceribacter sp. L1K23 TaxID=2820276 RepID=UPI001B82ABBD|nr:hypothetical protein [Ciceribacter sp. L1K23]MBR0556357.1 hypothetical protein [Ciceribacter sp. L1K23]
MKAALTMTATDLARALRRLAEAKVAQRVSAEVGEADGAGGSMQAPVEPRLEDGSRKARRRAPVVGSVGRVTAGRESGR